MVESNSRQFRVWCLNADYFDSGVNKDMIDEGQIEIVQKEFFRAMAGRLNLVIANKHAELAPHTRFLFSSDHRLSLY